MKLFNDIALITSRYIRITLKNPVFLIMGVGVPLTYLILFAPLLKSIALRDGLPPENVLNFFVPGMLPMIAFSTGIFAGFGIIDELRSGIIERFRVTPAHRLSLIAGPVLHDVCATFFQSLIFIAIALPFGFRANFLGLAVLHLILFLLALITSSFGNALGLVVKSEDRFAPLVQGIFLPILLLSGVLLPMSLAPKWLSIIAHFNPLYYAVEAAHALAEGNIATFPVLSAFLILIPMASFTLFWATGVFRKATS